MEIKQFTPADIETHASSLAEILVQTVANDGAVGFVMPLSRQEAAMFWQKKIASEVQAGDRVMFGAFDGDELAGTGQLIVGMPNNQPHRAEISKLMVHPNHRRKGFAKALMMILEQTARQYGRTLITLDTRTDDGGMPLYLALGYQVAGEIPNFAKNAVTDGFHSTTYMYKSVSQ